MRRINMTALSHMCVTVVQRMQPLYCAVSLPPLHPSVSGTHPQLIEPLSYEAQRENDQSFHIILVTGRSWLTFECEVVQHFFFFNSPEPMSAHFLRPRL